MEFVDRPRAEMNLIKIYPDEVYQEILGFGGALTESSAYVWSRMGAENKEKLLGLYFGPGSNDYNLCRIHIQSCDFSLGNRSYVEDGDGELTTFSIEGDPDVYPSFHKGGAGEKRRDFISGISLESSGLYEDQW